MTENKIKPTIEQAVHCLKAESERYPELCEECQLYGEVGCDHCYDDVTDMAIQALEKESMVNEILHECKETKIAGGWIPTSERLPEETGYYVVTHIHPLKDELSTTIFYYDSVRMVFTLPNDRTYDVKPIAWQPLPQPYNPEY